MWATRVCCPSCPERCDALTSLAPIVDGKAVPGHFPGDEDAYSAELGFLAGNRTARRKLNAILINYSSESIGAINHGMGEDMFEVARYVHPDIFVTNRGTGETFKFQVGSDGVLADQGIHFDYGDARRAAIAYLTRRRQAKEAVSQFLLSA
jgi:hypothetical protein